MKRKRLAYVFGERWWKTLGLKPYRPASEGFDWQDYLEHVVEQTAKCLRAYGLDPDLLKDKRGALVREKATPSQRAASESWWWLQAVPVDQRAAYDRPLIRDCWIAYQAARLCLQSPFESLAGRMLADAMNDDDQEGLAASILAERIQLARDRGRRKANQDRQSEADAKVLREFSNWQSRLSPALVVGGVLLSAEKRVKAFIRTLRSERKKRRIRDLLQAGKIPP